MSGRPVRIAVVLALIVALAAGYRWWTSPERQIRAILSDVAAAFTHDQPDDGLDALTAVAQLQKHLAPDLILEGRAATRLTGRDQAITAAARVRRASPAMRVRFFDPRITLMGETMAAVSVTAEVTTRTGSGEDVVDVLQVTARVERAERWVVKSARTAAEDPQS